MGNINLKISYDDNIINKINKIDEIYQYITNNIDINKQNIIKNQEYIINDNIEQCNDGDIINYNESNEKSSNETNISKKILKKKKKRKKKMLNENEINNIENNLFNEIEIENVSEKHIGIFIDGENISAKNCLDKINKFDRNYIDFIHVYGVNKSYYRTGSGKLMIRKKKSKWEKVSNDLGYNFIENSEYTMKNSLDMKMNCDIMKCLYERKYISHYILVTSDNDFRCLIEELCINNKKVTGITCNNNKFLWKNCDIISIKK